MRMKKSLPILLAGVLQLMPMLRAVLPMQAAQAFVPTTWAIVFKIGAGAVAMFGYHAISSATVFLPAGGTTFNLTAGAVTNLIIAYSGSHTPGSWSASPNPVCPGMTLAKGAASTTISGTPTTAGSYNANVTAWSSTSTNGDNGSVTYHFNVVAVGSPPVITNVTVAPSASVAPGSTVTFTPLVGGTAPFRYRWYFNNAPISGGTNTTLTKTSVQSSNAGNYTLIVTSDFGSATNTTALAVNGAPAITGPPQDQYVAVAGTANFSVTAGGAATLAYQWYKDGAILTGKTAAALSVTGVQATNAGRYWVVVSNSLGSATSSVAFLRISPSAVTSTSAIFALNYAWRYNTNAQDLGTSWRDFDYNDATWPSGAGILAKEDSGNAVVYPLIGTQFGGTSNGATFITNFYFRTHFTVTNKAQITGLILSNVVDDGAIFYLNGTEAFRYNMPAGIVTATTLATANLAEGVFTVSNLPTALLVQGDNVLAVEAHQVNNTSSDIVMGAALIGTFSTPNTAPLILTNPVTQSVNAGTNVTFTAAAEGSATLTYQWYKGAALVSGATGTTLTLTNVQAGDAATYTFVANNAYGSATSQVATLTVTVPTPPTITTQPLSQITPAGSNITFTVGTTGTGLSYLWRLNSNALVTATAASLTLTNVAPGNSGYYSVIVSNSGGSVTSSNAQLLVVPPPAPGSGPHFAPITINGGQFTISFPTSPGYRYLLQTNANLGTPSWGTLSNVPPSFNGATITLPQPSTASSLFYRVTVAPN